MQAMLNSGAELMLVGMGIVFLFLALLVLTVTLMTWAVRRYFPSPEPDASAVQQEAPPAEDDVIAVIGAAVHAFRSKR